MHSRKPLQTKRARGVQSLVEYFVKSAGRSCKLKAARQVAVGGHLGVDGKPHGQPHGSELCRLGLPFGSGPGPFHFYRFLQVSARGGFRATVKRIVFEARPRNDICDVNFFAHARAKIGRAHV